MAVFITGADTNEAFLQRMLISVVDASRRYARMTVLVGVLLAAGSGFYATHHPGANTGTD